MLKVSNCWKFRCDKFLESSSVEFFLVKYADGVLTDDGDVFLYGAKVVYKDFNISSSKVRLI